MEPTYFDQLRIFLANIIISLLVIYLVLYHTGILDKVIDNLTTQVAKKVAMYLIKQTRVSTIKRPDINELPVLPEMGNQAGDIEEASIEVKTQPRMFLPYEPPSGGLIFPS